MRFPISAPTVEHGLRASGVMAPEPTSGRSSVSLGLGLPGEGIVSSLISGGLNYFGQREANKANQRMAREQMQFQERMSNTAFQRATQDMIAAGINPILAAGAQSSSPSGAQATMQNEMSGAVSSALQAKALTAQVQQTKVMTELLRADLPEKQASSKIYGSSAGVALKALQEAAKPIMALMAVRRGFATRVSDPDYHDLFMKSLKR